ncbi:MAG: hypothetical protein NTZ78_03985 [Candidatus Aureabacteria bacterium]|nr:hypothetical protein [Candidatus Auribacterota bacterium]
MKKKIRKKETRVAESKLKYSAKRKETDKKFFFHMLSKSTRPLPQEDERKDVS